MITFQEILLRLQHYWSSQGCALLQPIDMEVGAGTSHTATFLRALGPEPWQAAYVQPSRRPKDGRYGENPNRLQHYYQYQVVLKPSPANIQDLYLGSLAVLGIDPRNNDIRFVEDDWENPTLGAWGLGWEVWLNGMEVTQFTYFQEVGGLICRPVLGEITYGVERLAMYLQGRDNLYDLVWTEGLTYGDVYHQNEVEQSRYNFEQSNAEWLFQQFKGFEAEAARLIASGLPLPGYEMVLKCSHTFNLLDASGAISVTERAAYIGRIRALARQVAQAYHDARAALGFPMLNRHPGAQEPARPAPLQAATAATDTPAAAGETPYLAPAHITETPAGATAAAQKTQPRTSLPVTEGPPDATATAPQAQPCTTVRATPQGMAPTVAEDSPLEDTLLIELRTEELPPKRLERMGHHFAESLRHALVSMAFVSDQCVLTEFASPRRLAFTLTGVRSQQPARQVERRGPNTRAAVDAAGQPTAALLGFARSCAVEVAQLQTLTDAKGQTVYVHRTTQPGQTLAQTLPGLLHHACATVPVAKVMRWGAGEDQFVRPVHGLVVLHGAQVVPLSLLGLSSGRTTLGHRFLSSGPLTLARAEDYATVLEQQGKVIAAFGARRQQIQAALTQAAGQDCLLAGPDLLEEVTALVEWPVIYAGAFDPAFLKVPQECLILSMQQHQKYFPLGDAQGRLLPRFLLVSNLETPAPQAIIAGNERVLRARLSDARFFYEQDRKTPLADRVPRLAEVVYHNRLGSMLQRTHRLQSLAQAIASRLALDPAQAARGALLMKADLLTDMVGEFPELQGLMGRDYALHDGESPAVAQAIEAHYHPRFAQDSLPQTPLGQVLALADKLDTLVGIFGIGQIPTGDKDPFALRRCALGVLRILIETPLPLSLPALLSLTAQGFASGQIGPTTEMGVLAFMSERLRGYLRDKGYGPEEIEAVLHSLPGATHGSGPLPHSSAASPHGAASHPGINTAPGPAHAASAVSGATTVPEGAEALPALARLDRLIPRLAALRQFQQLPEAAGLAAANKRIGNLLKKSANAPQTPGLDLRLDLRQDLLQEPAEIALHEALLQLEPVVDQHLVQLDYTEALRTLAQLKQPVDEFFAAVMVMSENMALRTNRLALLARLQCLMHQVADLARLGG